MVLAITQARIGSTRLPGKILKTINGTTLLEMHLQRILRSDLISKLTIATTNEPEAEKIVVIAQKMGVEVYKGSVDNVLERFYRAALPENPYWIVRLTSDCPLIDPSVIDKVINHAIVNDLDYASNVLTPTFPDGLDTEIFKFKALEMAVNNAKLHSELEHVTPFIWKNSTYLGKTLFRSGCVMNDEDYSSYRLTVDTLEDYLAIQKLVKLLGPDRPWIEYINALNRHPEIRKINDYHFRNEGYQKSLEKDEVY